MTENDTATTGGDKFGTMRWTVLGVLAAVATLVGTFSRKLPAGHGAVLFIGTCFCFGMAAIHWERFKDQMGSVNKAGSDLDATDTQEED